MALGYIDDSIFKDIADAIREKTGRIEKHYPADMANAINSIPTGGNLGTKTIIANGVYNAVDDSLDGYNSVTVNVPIPTFNTTDLTVSTNGVYNAITSGYDGFNEVNVQVPIPTYNSGTIDITENGNYQAVTNGYDGFSQVNVNVPIPTFNTTDLTVTSNGVYNALTSGYDGFTEVNVQVPVGMNVVVTENALTPPSDVNALWVYPVANMPDYDTERF